MKYFFLLLSIAPMHLFSQWGWQDEIKTDTVETHIYEYLVDGVWNEENPSYTARIYCGKNKGMFYRDLKFGNELDSFVGLVQQYIEESDSFQKDTTIKQKVMFSNQSEELIYQSNKITFRTYFQTKNCTVSFSFNEALELLLWIEKTKAENKSRLTERKK